ncbi:MAG: CHAT domain-containing protein [Acidobacteriota bacterium]|nr:CHAT domain-containing protein [Acidobacteriota bacterium]
MASLIPGKELVRKSLGESGHRYPVPLAAGAFASIHLKQEGGDLSLTLFDPADRLLTVVQGPHGSEGNELLCFISPTAGTYTLLVSREDKTGEQGYRIRLETRDTASEKDRLAARATRLTGEAYAAAQSGDLEQAAAIYAEAAGVWKEAGPTLQAALCRWHRAVMRRKQRESKAALVDYLTAAELLEGLKEPRLLASVYMRIGNIHNTAGRYEAAFGYYDRAAGLRKAPDESRASTLMNLAHACLMTTRISEGERALAEAQAILEQAGADVSLSRVHLTRGRLQMLRGEPVRALLEFDKGLDRLPEEHYRRIALLDEKSKAFRELQRWQEAYGAALQAEQRAVAGNRKGWLPSLNANMAELLINMGRGKEAEPLLRAALKHFEEQDSEEEIIHATYNLARIAATAEPPDLQNAIARLELAITRSEAVSRRARGSSLQSGLRGAYHTYRAYRLDLLMALAAAEPDGDFAARAANLAEHGRALLLETAMRTGPSPAVRTEAHARLSAEIANLAWQARDRDSSPAWARIDHLLRTYDDLTATDSSIEFGEPPDLIQLTRRYLKDDEALVYLAAGHKKVWAFVYSGAGFTPYELGDLGEISALVRSLLRIVDRRNSGPFRERIDELCGKLGARLAVCLPRQDEVRRLLVVAEGDLSSLPLNMLQLSEKGPRWISRYELVHLPSFSSLVLSADRQRPGRKPRNILLVADPIDMDAAALPALPHTRKEVTAIKRLAPGKSRILWGRKATRTALLENYGSGWDIVHLATHGLLFPGRGELSSLVLSPDEKHGALLTAIDVTGLPPGPALVVLSACESALGQRVAGEGIIGLPRAFLRGGASGVVVSLWPVDDAWTRQLMTGFYRHMIEEGKQPAAALRAAQSAMADKDPYAWAGFIYMGNPRTF